MNASEEVTYYKWSEVPLETVTPMLDRKLITGDDMMIAQVFLKKGCIVPRHQHHNEQITYILQGALRFWIGEDESSPFRRTSGTRRRRSRTRWTSTSSRRRARIG